MDDLVPPGYWEALMEVLSRTPLLPEFEKVLGDNLWDLYEE